ncbi:MAG: GAF domain-containing protein, partial [Holophagales bacterium]|nr:GAF domain-containing protein [Holophagales bacterium]
MRPDGREPSAPIAIARAGDPTPLPEIDGGSPPGTSYPVARALTAAGPNGRVAPHTTADTAGDPPLLELLEATARLVAEELDPPELAAKLATRAVEIFAADRALVALGDESSVRFAAVRASGGGSALELDEPTRGLLQALAPRRRRLLAGSREEMRDRLPATLIPSLERLGWQSLLAVPVLSHQGRMLGQILMVARRPGAYSPVQARLAETVACQLSVALERSGVITRLDDWTRGLQALLAFSAEVNRQVEAPLLVRHLVEHAARFLKADGGLAGLREEGVGGAE